MNKLSCGFDVMRFVFVENFNSIDKFFARKLIERDRRENLRLNEVIFDKSSESKEIF